MTTIAYDGHYIACDGRETWGNGVIASDIAEKWHITEKGIFFLTGSSGEVFNFAADFEDSKQTNLDDDTLGFYVSGADVYMVGICSGKFWKCNQKHDQWAIGSGSQFAVGALDHGKSAVDAVRYAITRDAKSGGKISLYDVKSNKFVTVKS